MLTNFQNGIAFGYYQWKRSVELFINRRIDIQFWVARATSDKVIKCFLNFWIISWERKKFYSFCSIKYGFGSSEKSDFVIVNTRWVVKWVCFFLLIAMDSSKRQLLYAFRRTIFFNHMINSVYKCNIIKLDCFPSLVAYGE